MSRRARAQTAAPALAGSAVLPAKRIVFALALATSLLWAPGARLSAQDTAQVYPWRLSYFPYLTASPNDGVMAMARAVWFRQSRWDDRVSVHDQVAVEGGYSTKDSWLLRARGDFPRIGDGWRLQAFGEAARFSGYLPGNLLGEAATRQIAGAEVTRVLHGRLFLALRGEVMHINIPIDLTVLAITAGSTTETDLRARLALVYDGRDREYDTRSGSLLQGGAFLGSAATGYRGWYALAAGWAPLSATTRVTARVGARMMDHQAIDASRLIPAWEDEFVVLGGPESNRALVAGAQTDGAVSLASAEIRHDLFAFPGGGITLLAFVDGGSTYAVGTDAVVASLAHKAGALSSYSRAARSSSFSAHWILGPGAGVALRLLRNAVLTATVARADGATRIYVSSGWSW